MNRRTFFVTMRKWLRRLCVPNLAQRPVRFLMEDDMVRISLTHPRWEAHNG